MEVSESQGEEFFYKEINKLLKSDIDSLSGVLIESFQGWGACSYPKSFIKAISNFCIERNILFCFDEMQAGFYRTGKKFGFEHYNVRPDIICIGKGMGGGLPSFRCNWQSRDYGSCSASELSVLTHVILYLVRRV